MNYDVDYFINKFEAIPEDRWCMNEFRIGSAKCANGHCGLTDEFQVTVESLALREMFLKLPIHYLGSGYKVDGAGGKYSINAAMINDGRVEEYRQPTPKQRILAALQDIKAMTKDIDTVKKERIVYVSVPATITEKMMGLVLS